MKYLLVLAFFLVGCEPSEMYPAGAGAGVAGSSGSGSYSTPAKTVPTPPAPMLQDPEGNLQDSGIEFVAQNETEALNKCQQEAASLSSADTIVSCLGCRIRTKTTNKFICTMRTEVIQLPPREP
jgi:hypothetical protein